MLRRELLAGYLEHYKVENKTLSFEDIAKLMVKCKILDNRETKYNIVGYSFDELLYNELMDIRENISLVFMRLIDYSLYFEQKNEKPLMIEPIYQALNYLTDVINKTGEQRKKCRYKNVIQTIAKYEKDFYDDNLRNCTESEKEIFIKNDLIDNTGIFLYTLQYFRITNFVVEEEAEEFWNAIMKLVVTIDKVGEQRKIKKNKDIEESICRKTQIYLTKNNKKVEDLMYNRNK